MSNSENHPSLWRHALPIANPQGHKYGRGMAVIYGAPKMTGATRLAASAAARIGAGLVKVVAPEGTGEIYRASLPAHIIVEDYNPKGRAAFDASKVTSVLIGPGCPPSASLRELADTAMRAGNLHGIVLDAGGFLSFKNKGRLNEKIVVTPHDGELAAFFGDDFIQRYPNRTERADAACQALGCTVVLKGPQTVIAGEGGAIVNDRPDANLATAGAGDVLAGMMTGLIAQGMPAFEAAAAAVWIHSEAAARIGPGLVASDLPDAIPFVLRTLDV